VPRFYHRAVFLRAYFLKFSTKVPSEDCGETRRIQQFLTKVWHTAGAPAYLHRKEGDQSNAAYWYSRAGKPVCRESLEAEWLNIVKGLLG
jgi:hypothetical protein